MRNIGIASVTIIVLVALLVPGCGTPVAPAVTPVAGGETPAPSAVPPTPTIEPEKLTLIVAFAQTAENIDPNMAQGSPVAQTIVSNVYDPLTEYAKIMTDDGYYIDDSQNFVGAMADSFEMSADGTSITYHIRDGLTFHDGTPLTAEEMKYTFDRIVDTKKIAYVYPQMAGALTADDFEVTDDHTLVVHIDPPYNALAMHVLNVQNIVAVNPVLVKENATDDDPWAENWLAMNEAGSGPFVLEKYDPTSEVVLRRFEDYGRGPAALERVIIKIIPSGSDRILALESGDVDMIMDVPPKDVARLEANPDIKMIAAPSRGMVNLTLTNTIPPLDNVKVRQAIAYAVPYDTIVDEVYRGYAQRLRGMYIWHGSPTYTEDFCTYETNLDTAKALLAEAGYPDGFETSLAVVSGVDEDEEMAVWIKKNLEQIGITVNVESLPQAAWLTRARAGDLPMFIHHRLAFVDDPFYGWPFYVGTGGLANFGQYSNPEVDDLVNEYALSADAEARADASVSIQKILCETVPVVPLVQPTYNVAMKKNVEGYHFASDGTFVTRFYTMYKD